LGPELAERHKFRQPVFVAEVALDRLLALEPTPIAYKRLPRFPSVVRDVSLVVPRAVSYAEVESTVRLLGIPDFAGVALHDIFVGGQIPKDHQSMTLRVTFRGDERTLTDDEVAASHARIVDELTRRFGATLRS
jgi:phenylalanyl-tRNA synthetase beta chain